MRFFSMCRRNVGVLFLICGIFAYIFVGSQVAEIIGEDQSQHMNLEERADTDERQIGVSSAESEERPERNQSGIPQQEANSAEGKEGGEGEGSGILEPPGEVASRRKVSGAPSRDYEEKMIKALVKEAYLKVTGEGGDEEVLQSPAYALEVQPSSRNTTPPNSNLVFFSAVPKCGSSTTGHLFKKLSALNNFYSLTPQQRIQPVIDEEQQKTLLENLFSLSEKVPVAYTRHLYYFNTTKLGFPRASWVAIVRHPVERLISQFYYARIPSRYLENKLLQGRMPSAEFMNMTLDTCVPQRDPRCWYREGSRQMLQLSFFCGQDSYCTSVGSRRALQMAKYNAENFYSAVGVLEDLHLSYRVLEKYLPRFFARASVSDIGTGRVRFNSQENKPSVKNSTRLMMESYLKEDLDLYHFLKQRLHLQAQAIESGTIDN
ncbi:heparan sulfate 2-O-sulfotransferase pipe-like [Penaeus indicus]|uniref:heparan sulfate 2-O-sulfotransferase pipe-like n=1 Tax=Penaeus indicus TaxID=29960 RepID=UPI00300CA266